MKKSKNQNYFEKLFESTIKNAHITANVNVVENDWSKVVKQNMQNHAQSTVQNKIEPLGRINKRNVKNDEAPNIKIATTKTVNW